MRSQDPRENEPQRGEPTISSLFPLVALARYPGGGQLLRTEIPGKLSKILQSWEDKNYSSGLPRQPRFEGPRSLTAERQREGSPALFLSKRLHRAEA